MSRVHRDPPHVRDDAYVPLAGAGWRINTTISDLRKEKCFRPEDWRTAAGLNRRAKFDFSRMEFRGEIEQARAAPHAGSHLSGKSACSVRFTPAPAAAAATRSDHRKSERAQGRPGAGCSRSLAWDEKNHTSKFTTGSTEQVRPSPRDCLRLSPQSPDIHDLFSHRP